MAPHLRDGSLHVPLEDVLPALEACGIEVIDFDLLRAKCPAEDLHTTDSRPGECVIFPNRGVPQICCHHTSCTARVDAVNRQLRTSSGDLARAVAGKPTYTATQRHTWHEQRRRREELTQKATNALPVILEKYHWPASSIAAESPVEISLPVERQHRYIFDLFDDDDLLWCAPSVKCTGAYWHTKHFRRAVRWAGEYKCPGAFICPNAFGAGSFSRSDVNIARNRFLVVESDTLSRDQVGAVFKWMSVCLGMSLRAVVDTGGRSLHGWFEYPSEGLPEKLKIILTGFGCDPAMFRPAQPCRLPGIRRDTGRWQELLYLAPSSSGVVRTNADGPPPRAAVAI